MAIGKRRIFDMPRAMILNSYKNTKLAIDAIVNQFGIFRLNDSSINGNNKKITLNSDLSVPDIKESESGIGTIYDCSSFNLASSLNIANSTVNRFQLNLRKTETPVNFVYTANVIGFYSTINYATNSDLSSDDFEILFTGGIRGQGTLDTEEDNLLSSSCPIDTITIRNTGYLNIIVSGLIHIINRTAPTD